MFIKAFAVWKVDMDLNVAMQNTDLPLDGGVFRGGLFVYPVQRHPKISDLCIPTCSRTACAALGLHMGKIER